MSKRSHLIVLPLRSASLSCALLLGVLACSSTSDPNSGTGGLGTAGAGVAGASTGGAGAPSGAAGASAGAAGSAIGSAGASTGSAGSAGAAAAGGADVVGGSGGALGTAGSAGSGTSGAGGTAAGAGGGAGGGAADCSAFKLCDGFEGDAPGKGTSPWTASGGTALVVTTDQHHNGTHSVHITAPNTSGFAATISEKKTFPAADFWGRAFLRFKGDGGGHQMYIAVNLSGDQLRLLNRLGSDNAQVNFQKSDKFYNTNSKIPMETWFCYEWHVTTSAVNVFIDGKAQTTNPAIPGITGGTSLSLGYTRYATGTAAGELWIDDVAVNDKQIGCE